MLADAWARKERRHARYLAVVAYCAMASAGGKATFDEVVEMMGAPAERDGTA